MEKIIYLITILTFANCTRYTETTFGISYDMGPNNINSCADLMSINDDMIPIFQIKIDSVEKLDHNDSQYKTTVPCNNTMLSITENSANIKITDQCITGTGATNYDCSSWFRVKFRIPPAGNEFTPGEWRFQINGLNSSKLFVDLQASNRFAYWIDTMEIMFETENKPISIGFIYGHEPLQSSPIMFDKTIHIKDKYQAKSALLKYTRKCNNNGINLQLGNNPFPDNSFTNYTITSIHTQKMK